MKIVLFWVFPVLIVWYLLALNRLVSALRADFGEAWRAMGNPNIWEARGQKIVFRLVVFPKSMPFKLLDHHLRKICIIRVLGIAGLSCFLVILLMILTGSFK